MKKFGFILIILACFANTSCIKRMPVTPDRNVLDAFGIFVKDTSVDTSSMVDLNPQIPLDKNNHVSFQSRDWLDASRRMFESADVLGTTQLYDGRLHLIKMAHELANLYYSSSNATTPMTPAISPPGNPYLEEAYFYVKDTLNTQYQATMTNASAHVTSAAGKVVVAPGPKITDGPIDMNQVFSILNSVFNDFIKNLKVLDDDSTKAVTEQIASQVQTSYLTFLNTARDSANMKDPKESSLSYATRIQNLVKTAPSDFLSEDVKSTADKALQEIVYFAGQVDQCTTPDTTMQTFINLWNAKENRAKYPAKVNTAIRVIFNGYKDEQVVAFIDDNKLGLVSKDDWPKIAPKKPDIIKAVNANPDIVAYAKTLMEAAPSPTQIDPAQNGADVFAAIVNDWYNMDFRSNLAEMKSLWQFSENDLNLMYQVKSSLFWQGHVVLAIARTKILSLLTTFNTPFPNSASFSPGIDWFKGYVNYKIIHAIQAEIASQILKVAPSIPDQIKTATLKSLADLKSSSQHNVGDLFKSLGTTYLTKWIFDAQGSLPLIEKNQVSFAYSTKQLAPIATSSETSAEVLGLGFSNSVERLNSLYFLNLKPDQPAVRAMVFQTLCKMAALSGYTGIEGKPVPSLMSLFPDKSKKQIPFDLATYDPSTSVYAATDDIRLVDNYKLDPNQKAPYASVRGQMEMLAGLTKMMQYLKPWNPSTFDPSLAALRIDEFPTQAVFDKGSMFQQALGLAATIIKNLPAQMVALITLDDKVYPMSQVKDLATLELGGAVITDFTPAGISHVIKTHDLATAVIAVGEFFNSVGDLSSSQDKTVRDAAVEIEGQRNLINQLFLGISMFSLSKLMAEDGGFVTSYNLDTLTPSTDPRLLSDQLLMDEALLVIGNFLNRNFIRLRAIDNFFFLNSFMWNNQLGFYNFTDDKTQVGVHLADVAEALKLTALLKPLLTTLAQPNPALRPSVLQLEKFQKLWSDRFLNDQTAAVTSILKLGAFVPVGTVVKAPTKAQETSAPQFAVKTPNH